MKRRILSLLLAVAIVTSVLPTALAAGHTITVTPPAAATLKTGELYLANLTTVFQDEQGHGLTYALDRDYGSQVYIKDDGTFVFSMSAAGEYAVTIAAACDSGATASAVFSLTVEQAGEGSGNQYNYNETPASSVKVFVTVSNDGVPVIGNDGNQTLLSHLEVEVPYFDLAGYGLEQFYRYGTADGTGPYVNETLIERPTALHLYIYLLEHYYLGLPEELCGQGNAVSGLMSYDSVTPVMTMDGLADFDGTAAALSLSGSATSMYMRNFWGHDENLMYYRNHMYPLMSPGWGSTADYVLLSDSDTIDVAMFSNWDFYQYGAFTCFDQDAYTVSQGDTLAVQVLKFDTNAEAAAFEPMPDMHVSLYDSDWNFVRTVSDGQASDLCLNTGGLNPGNYYLLGLDPNMGTNAACFAPATARLTVEKTSTPAGYLSELKITDTASIGEDTTTYPLTPAFSDRTWEYTVVIPDNKNAAYFWADLSDTAPEGATIQASWVDKNNGQSATAVIASGKATGMNLAGYVKTGDYPNTVTLTVGVGEDVQTYVVNLIRTPSLRELRADIPLNETFADALSAYTATTTADSITFQATPVDTGYTITYNGQSSPTVALDEGENIILIRVSNADGRYRDYTVTVNRVKNAAITFDVTPTDAVVYLTDSFGVRLWPDENGVYTVLDTAVCNYAVTRTGYVAATGTVTAGQTATVTVSLTKAENNAAIDTTMQAEWPTFRRTEDNLGITDAKTPTSTEDSELLWACQFGSGWGGNATASPVVVDDCIITYAGTNIYKVNKDTGAIVAQGQMVAASSYSIMPATYAGGVIYVALSGGRLQAFNADTLESLWVYTDPLGGQSNCPVAYKDGYVYVGYWYSETGTTNFVCLSATDEDIAQSTETKHATWTYARAGGFYWAGAYVSDKYVVVGSDDGTGGNTSETASLLVFDRFTGKLVDSVDDILGDIRSSICYDANSNRVFFTTKGGLLCNAVIDWETGKISDMHRTVIVNSKGTEYAMSTCTPSVYNDRVYIGIAGDSQFTPNSGHGIAVYDLAADGAMTQAYVYDIVGYPQTSAMLTTAYEAEEGCVYIYMPYNAQPGGISVLKDRKGQTEPITTSDSGYSEIFTPQIPLANYCLGSTVADEYGTVYYKNDSAYLMAITSRIESIEVTAAPDKLHYDDEPFDAAGMTVVANLANGLQRDITDYVTWQTENVSAGQTAVTLTYTYGFDSENYGLKTKTVDVPVNMPVKTVEVDLIAQADNAFLAAPGRVQVTSDLAERYGYTDQIASSDGVSALDVLVRAHELVFGEAFTVRTARSLLEVNDTGSISMLFGVETYSCGFTVNHVSPTTDEEASWGGYVGLTLNETPVSSGDDVNFYLYQDSYYMDWYTWYEQDGQMTRSLTGEMGQPVSFTVRGYSVGWYGCNYKTLEAVRKDTKTAVAAGNVQIAIVNTQTGELTDIADAVADENGNVAVTFPEAGVYTITARTVADDETTPVVLTLATVTVGGHTHVFGQWTERTAATCTTAGEEYRACACGAEETRAIPALGHDFTATNVPAACTADGYTLHTCSRCGYSYRDQMVDAIGHNWSDWTVQTEPTCVKTGLEARECANCGQREERVLPAAGHDCETTAVEPTCTTEGYTLNVCKNCGYRYRDNVVDAIGHDWSDWTVQTEPTCVKTGLEARECANCGQREERVLPAAGHDCETTVVEPTCTTEGYTLNVCRNCGYRYRDNIADALGHDWDGGTVTTAPTETATGVKTFTCSRCDATRTEEIPALDCPSATFTDVNAGQWYHTAVDFVVANGYMAGVDATTFGPNTKISRAMIVTVLYRIEGKPQVSLAVNPFADVAQGQYYTQAVLWAYSRGIISGVSTSAFAPDAPATREQIAAIIYRWADAVPVEGDYLSDFRDHAHVSPYAVTAMNWAVSQGLISGQGNQTLAPKANTTRAEMASILMRYLQE